MPRRALAGRHGLLPRRPPEVNPMSVSAPLLNGLRSSDAPGLRLRIESGIAAVYRSRQGILSVVLALQALQRQLVREVLYRMADLLCDLLGKHTLDGELLGELSKRRDHLQRILLHRILHEGVELSSPGRLLLPQALLPKLVTEPRVTVNAGLPRQC